MHCSAVLKTRVETVLSDGSLHLAQHGQDVRDDVHSHIGSHKHCSAMTIVKRSGQHRKARWPRVVRVWCVVCVCVYKRSTLKEHWEEVVGQAVNCVVHMVPYAILT